MSGALRNGYELLRDAGKGFVRDKATRLGAALAFYTALSLSPLLVVVLAVAGFVYREDAARGELAHQISGLVGDEGGKAIQEMMKNQTHEAGVLATVIGVVTLLAGATGVFAQLQDSLDAVWNVEAEQIAGGVWAFVRDRLLSFSLVLVMAFLLLVSLVASAVFSAANGVAERWFPGAGAVLGVANVVLSFLLVTVLFAVMFKVLPHVRPRWSDVWVGAAVTAALFTLGKFLIGLYLGKASVGSAYGAAGSFVVLLFWIYYSSQIFLFGAEVTEVYAARHGSGLKRHAGPTPRPAPSPNGAIGTPVA